MALLDTKPFIIADVGSNWRRSEHAAENLALALRHIESAKACGASAVKFQLFTHEELYGRAGDNTYALPRDWVPGLKAHADKVGIEFMCTAFSVDGYRFVDPYVNVHKVASAEFCHEGIWDFILSTNKKFIMSTGGASDKEVKDFIRRYSETVTYTQQGGFAILECVATYPAEVADYNLSGMREMARCPAGEWHVDHRDFGFHLGISDHTLTNVVALTSIGFGATIFEKHFDAQCDFEGFPNGARTPDSAVSIGTREMTHYCASLREAFTCIGDGVKRPREPEADFVKYARRPHGVNTYRPGKP